jgi:carboxypeptidase PM20D1
MSRMAAEGGMAAANSRHRARGFMAAMLLAALGLMVALSVAIAWRTATFGPLRAAAVAAAGAVQIAVDAVASRLAEAIRHPTISYLEADRWQSGPFDAFLNFLEREFPGVHQRLDHRLIGGHTVLFRWPGAEPARDPVLLLAHYDVVPVEPGTDGAWTHPPFAGVIADGYVWGRGALDNKGSVLAILEAVEMLVAEGFQPERTVLLAFGHDEEIGGVEGAARVAAYFAERDERLGVVLDEGGFIVPDNGVIDGPLALVGTAEKGYLSLHLAVHGAGGHSSQPPPETPVGILAGAIHRIERAGFEPRLMPPTQDLFRHVAPELPVGQRLVFANEWLFRPLIVRQLAADHLTNAMIRTTAAPTMLRGSDKDNVLPVTAEAVINFRLLPGDTVDTVIARVRRIVDDARVELAPIGIAIDSSPVTTTDTAEFALLARTIREIRADTTVAPYLVIGATDARHFVALANHVYRFLPFEVTRAWSAPAGVYREQFFFADPTTRAVLFEGPAQVRAIWGLQGLTDITDEVREPLELPTGTLLVVFGLGGVSGGEFEVEVVEAPVEEAA